jgi:hypothetical protein
MAEAPFTIDLAKRQLELEAELLHPEEPDAEVVRLETPRTRFMRGLEISRRLDAGLPVCAEDVRWFDVYSTQPEYRANRRVYEDFGEAALEA